MSNNEIPCRASQVQEYQCQVKCFYEPLDKDIAFDACLARELFFLWDRGVVTLGCCCGKHAGGMEKVLDHSYIQVEEESADLMIELGYEKAAIAPPNISVYKPKTKL